MAEVHCRDSKSDRRSGDMLRLRRDVMLFPGGKQKAFTMSYDDGVTQDEQLITLMERYGIRGTFNLNPGLMGDNDWLVQGGTGVNHNKFSKDKIAEIYKNQEIAVHSMTHPDLTKVPVGMVSYEITECRKELEELVKHPVTGMAYPFGTWSEEVERAAEHCGIIYARTTKPTYAFSMPQDFLAWHPTCHHTDEKMFELLDKFLEAINQERYMEPWLYYLWGHAYEFDSYNQWNEIERFLKTVGNREEIWYATNGEICEYINAVKSLVYSATGDYIYNPTCVDVWMQVDGKAYEIKVGETIEIEYEHR